MIESESETKPLVSLILLAYRQEEFIREAVIGLLSQDYSPLEIILSDDCSPDSTFEVIEKIVEGYSGDARVVVRQNQVNQGFIGHWNTLLSMCQGEWIVVAAGDDISRSDRVSRVMDTVFKKRELLYVNSDFAEIDFDGELVVGGRPHPGLDLIQSHEDFLEKKPAFMGASAAFHRCLFDNFGAISKGAMCEDRVFAYRGWLLGRIAMVREPLIQRRVHGDNLSSKIQWIERSRVLGQHLKDLLVALKNGETPPETPIRMIRRLVNNIVLYRLMNHRGKVGELSLHYYEAKNRGNFSFLKEVKNLTRPLRRKLSRRE